MAVRKRKPVEANDGSYGGMVLAEFDRQANPKCPKCGYDKVDSAIWGDHDRCKGEIVQGKSVPPQSNDINDYVAWLCFRNRKDNQQPYLAICDSDTPGAFKVYRHPAKATGCGCDFCNED